MPIGGQVQKQTRAQRVSEDDAIVSDLCQRIPDRLFRKRGIERRGRIAVAREIDRIHFETSISECGGDELHDLFAHIEAMHYQDPATRSIGGHVSKVWRWRTDLQDAAFSLRFKSENLGPREQEHRGGKCNPDAHNNRMLY